MIFQSVGYLLLLLALSACHSSDGEDVKTTPLANAKIMSCEQAQEQLNSHEAFPYCLQEATKNNTKAQRWVAQCFINGDGVKTSQTIAKSWLLMAAQLGDSEASLQLAKLMIADNPTKQDIKLVESLLRQAAKNDHIEAMVELAKSYQIGLFHDQNSQAQFWFQKASNLGEPEAHYQLAMLLMDKYGEPETIMQLLHKAAKQEHGPAQFALAKIYQQGEMVEQNTAIALGWFAMAAKHQIPEALFITAKNILDNSQNTTQRELALRYLKMAADQDYIQAQYLLASISTEGELSDESRSSLLKYLNPAAQQGNVDAQLKLAKALMSYNIPRYDETALHWLQVAANKSSEAQYLLADFYLKGIGVSADYQKAFSIFQKLAQQGHAGAQGRLGSMYYYGQGVDSNNILARKWLQKATEQGNNEAEVLSQIIVKHPDYSFNDEFLENHYEEDESNWREQLLNNVEHGEYVSKDTASQYSERLEAHIQAAKNNDWQAQLKLAQCYFDGEGTRVDLIKSYAWALIAEKNGSEEAYELKEKIATFLSSDEISEAQSIVNRFQLTQY